MTFYLYDVPDVALIGAGDGSDGGGGMAVWGPAVGGDGAMPCGNTAQCVRHICRLPYSLEQCAPNGAQRTTISSTHDNVFPH